MHRLRPTAFALAAWASISSARADVTIHEGGPGVPGRVAARDEATGAITSAPAELDSVELLPFESAGRTVLEEFLPGKARRLEDVAGASRLVLPDFQGSLYHYVRGAGGARTYGYFLVTRAGLPRVLVERPGVGPTGLDPFLERVAVAPDGRAFLCATRIGAGGDLLEVRFGGATTDVVDRTAGAPPLRFGARGLALTATHAWALSGRGLLRGARGANDVVLVSYGAEATPAHYQGDLVTSTRGTAVAFLAGSSADSLHVWTAATDGPARRASASEGPYQSAGFMPEHADGPYLAVNDDATWCAWKTRVPAKTGAISYECLVARASAPASELPEMLSSDARFIDTLDEVAVFFFRGPTQLVFSVGEQGTPAEPGIDRSDVFRADLTPGGTPTLTNLSGTSGDFSVPFTALPDLEATRWVLTPDRRSLLLHNDQGSGNDLLAVDTATGSTVALLSNVKSFDWIELCGRRFVFGIQRLNGPRYNEVYSILADLTGAPVRSYQSNEDEPTRGVAARADGRVAWLRRTGLVDVLQRARVPSAVVETWSPAGGFTLGQAWSNGDALVFGQSGAVRAWPVGGAPATSWSVGATFRVLPGA